MLNGFIMLIAKKNKDITGIKKTNLLLRKLKC
jgi:hypothetical protein